MSTRYTRYTEIQVCFVLTFVLELFISIFVYMCFIYLLSPGKNQEEEVRAELQSLQAVDTEVQM